MCKMRAGNQVASALLYAHLLPPVGYQPADTMPMAQSTIRVHPHQPRWWATRLRNVRRTSPSAGDTDRANWDRCRSSNTSIELAKADPWSSQAGNIPSLPKPRRHCALASVSPRWLALLPCVAPGTLAGPGPEVKPPHITTSRATCQMPSASPLRSTTLSLANCMLPHGNTRTVASSPCCFVKYRTRSSHRRNET